MTKSTHSLYQTLQLRIKKELKHYKRQTFLLKVKVFLLVILPAVIALLAAKTVQVWISLKLRDSHLPEDHPLVQSVQQESVPNEFITPEPLYHDQET